uniref:GNAT family N-acetyltransferase n=1 Tax=Eubacterium sp. TaxID=142586 RepID=UPI00402556F6
MKIEKMTINDYDKVYALWLSCKGIGLNSLDDTRAGIDRFINRNPDTCFVAIDNKQIVGSILVGNDGRRGYIYHTAVEPEYQRKGIGKALVDKSMEALNEIGINKVALVAFKQNETGNKFWDKMGFEIRGDLIYRNKSINKFTRIDT